MNFKKENLSPTAITAELQEAVLGLPDSKGWEDYFEGGAGRTIIELIAGSQAIKNHYNLMRVREGSLQYAKLESSITELALNKGVYKLPAKTYIGKITFIPLSNAFINNGQEIGTYSDFKVYATETTVFELGIETSIEFILGNKASESVTIDTDTEFSILDVLMSDRYITGEFQFLTVNGEDVVIASEQLNLYDENLPKSALRIVYDHRVKLIFGDDIVGKLLKKNDVVSFDYVTFGDKLIKRIDPNSFSFSLISSIGSITKIETIRNATGYIDKEHLRLVAMRNSIDGRWVLPQDYRGGILKEFGQYLYDILVIDSYPTEKIYLLGKEYMVDNALKNQISELIDNRRGNAVLVEQTYIDPADSDNYQDVLFEFSYLGKDSGVYLEEAVSAYKESIEFKFRDGDFILTSEDMAVDLTKLLSDNAKGRFYERVPKVVTVPKYTFIRNLSITYTR